MRPHNEHAALSIHGALRVVALLKVPAAARLHDPALGVGEIILVCWQRILDEHIAWRKTVGEDGPASRI